MKTIYIGVNIDWSKSFVDKNGGFYCGTTEEQKLLTAILMPYLNLVVNTTDFHSVKSREFKANGGLWPFHNVAEFGNIDVKDLGLAEGTTISPEQTRIIDDAINKETTGIIVPRHVYFQDGEQICFTPELVEKAFGHKIITPRDFFREDFTYVIAPKTHFDATTVVSSRALPLKQFERIPLEEYTVFDLIQEKYSKDRKIVYIGTGVVDNICRHLTTMGLKQKYDGIRVVNIIGATTPLLGFGFNEKEQVRKACEGIQTGIGIEHKTLDEMLLELEGEDGCTNI